MAAQEFEDFRIEDLGCLGIGDEGFVVFDAGGVGKEVADEDVAADVGGKFGEPETDGVVDGEPVVFFEEQDGHGGELFCERGHAEVGGRVEGDVGVQVGEAGGFLVEGFAVFFYGEGDAGLVGGEGMKEGVEAGG